VAVAVAEAIIVAAAAKVIVTSAAAVRGGVLRVVEVVVAAAAAVVVEVVEVTAHSQHSKAQQSTAATTIANASILEHVTLTCVLKHIVRFLNVLNFASCNNQIMLFDARLTISYACAAMKAVPDFRNTTNSKCTNVDKFDKCFDTDKWSVPNNKYKHEQIDATTTGKTQETAHLTQLLQRHESEPEN
jgi:hypothetical protein